ncbi:hypothetical protein D3C80_1605940 [compost metagenome]
MRLETFESPINRLGFVLLTFSVALCLIAFFVSYRSYYDIGWNRLAYLLLDSSTVWQQHLFKFGFFGVLVGSMMAWNFVDLVKRVYKWVRKT